MFEKFREIMNLSVLTDVDFTVKEDIQATYFVSQPKLILLTVQLLRQIPLNKSRNKDNESLSNLLMDL